MNVDITDPLAHLRSKATEMYTLLIETYGERPLVPRREPVQELIMTILSHRTTHANEEKAFRQMWERYGSWEAIRDADVSELALLVAPSNFPEAKAPNIKATLKQIIEERGAANIDFLKDLSAKEGLAWLDRLPGVGIKTATLVLLFCFAKPIMPVDTHVHRISQRTGLIGAKVNAEAAHWALLDLLPHEPYVLYNFHKAMLKHGQTLCVWGTPKCAPCPLKHLCNWYQTNVVDQAAR